MGVNHRDLCHFGLAILLSLAGLLWSARPAAAQIWIAPNRSVANIGQQVPLQLNGGFNVTPVVVPGNMYVRVGGSYSFSSVIPGGFPGTGFVKPFYAEDRARASNFRGGPNYNPNPVITGPWRKWW